jgi:hypothetical protein
MSDEIPSTSEPPPPPPEAQPPLSQTDQQRLAPQPNQALPTEEEHRQAKIDKAAQTGDLGSDVQPNPKAAADQLAAMVAPTPAIPGRPETATAPLNVAQRQRAGLQPLPTDEELKELEAEAGPIVELAKKFFWIADEAGDPMVDTGTNAIFLHYPDGSQISVRFECRPGEFGAIGHAAVTDADSQARNRKFSDAKKVRDQKRGRAQEAAKTEAAMDAHAREEAKPGEAAFPAPQQPAPVEPVAP